jgi:hypothetical protein
MNEYEHEPVRGLPETLPAGENIVWQGEPRWQAMAARVFHTRMLALYFGLLIALHFGSRLLAGDALEAALASASWQLGLAGATLGILSLMAYLYARSTVYTLTNRRLVIRFGVAIPMMINIPLDTVESASLRDLGNGTGEIALTLLPGFKASYWALWPNARPWHYSRVKPMLRCIPQAESVAASLAAIVARDGETVARQAAPGTVEDHRGSELPQTPRAVAAS